MNLIPYGGRRKEEEGKEGRKEEEGKEEKPVSPFLATIKEHIKSGRLTWKKKAPQPNRPPPLKIRDVELSIKMLKEEIIEFDSRWRMPKSGADFFKRYWEMRMSELERELKESREFERQSEIRRLLLKKAEEEMRRIVEEEDDEDDRNRETEEKSWANDDDCADADVDVADHISDPRSDYKSD